ncbi:sortase [Candidatus Kaiserbacteria bacterium]|nr:sortase [Candidatus Kaiserbacteria bacterium]
MTKRPVAFALTFVAFFALSFAFLSLVDALPEPISTSHSGVVTHEPAALPAQEVEPGLPLRITAESIGLDITVSNPTETSDAALNNALLKGTVRYPSSMLLGQTGAVLILGHSSYLPIVHNQNYKAFNHIKELKADAVVSVYSDTTEYRYRVVGVRQGRALASTPEDVVELPNSGNGKYLVLVTCDSFGSKSDRYIVTAEFLGAYSI